MLRSALCPPCIEPTPEPEMASTFTFEAHPAETRTGLWCDRCNLPSAVSVTVAFAASDSLRVLGRATGEHCELCGITDVTR